MTKFSSTLQHFNTSTLTFVYYCSQTSHYQSSLSLSQTTLQTKQKWPPTKYLIVLPSPLPLLPNTTTPTHHNRNTPTPSRHTTLPNPQSQHHQGTLLPPVHRTPAAQLAITRVDRRRVPAAQMASTCRITCRVDLKAPLIRSHSIALWQSRHKREFSSPPL